MIEIFNKLLPGGNNDPFYDKMFTCENMSLTRRELESFSCPFCTKNVTDDLMMKVASTVNYELSKWNLEQKSDEELEFTYEDARLYEIDNAAAKLGVPYYKKLQ